MSNAALDKIIDEVNKKYGDGTIIRASEIGYKKRPRLKTGSLALDLITGGGWPIGLITEMYGPAASGKTTISFFTIAEAQKENLECVFIDAEDSFGFHNSSYVKNCGVDLKNLTLVKTNKAENVLEIIKKLLASETPPDLIVVDSIAALMPSEDLEKDFETPTMATRARLLSRGLGVITSLNKKTAILLINQLRSTLSPYGNPITSPGGLAMKHYPALKVEIKAGDFLTEGKQRIGHIIKFKVTKSKVGTPWRDSSAKLYYKGEIDKYEEAITLGLINDVIIKAGGWYSFEDQKVQGQEALEELFKNDKNLFKKLQKKLGL